MKKAMYGAGLVFSMSFVTGWTFGLLHLPGAWQLEVYGFLGFAFIFLPLLTIDLFKSKNQSPLLEKLKIILGLSSTVLVAVSVVFKVLHLPGAPVLLMAGTGLFVFGFLPLLFLSFYKKSIS